LSKNTLHKVAIKKNKNVVLGNSLPYLQKRAKNAKIKHHLFLAIPFPLPLSLSHQ
jgi:hypothetical protein